ncbi:MAG: hypothetical protein ACUVRV_01000 [Cyanobacteriota bacterium]
MKPATVEIAPGPVPVALTTGELQQGPLHCPPFAVTFRQLSTDGNTFILTVSSWGTLLNRFTPYDFTFPGVALANPVSFSFRTRLN